MFHTEAGHIGNSSKTHGTGSQKRSTAYSIHPDRKLVVVTFGTCVTAADIVRYAKLLQADPLFKPQFSEIVDLTTVEQLDLQSDDFLRLADEIDPFSPDAKRAFVARSSVQKHAARMHKILRSKRNIEIFPSLQDAERWIQP